jgi:hypothetical protein
MMTGATESRLSNGELAAALTSQIDTAQFLWDFDWLHPDFRAWQAAVHESLAAAGDKTVVREFDRIRFRPSDVPGDATRRHFKLVYQDGLGRAVDLLKGVRERLTYP